MFSETTKNTLVTSLLKHKSVDSNLEALTQETIYGEYNLAFACQTLLSLVETDRATFPGRPSTWEVHAGQNLQRLLVQMYTCTKRKTEPWHCSSCFTFVSFSTPEAFLPRAILQVIFSEIWKSRFEFFCQPAGKHFPVHFARQIAKCWDQRPPEVRPPVTKSRIRPQQCIFVGSFTTCIYLQAKWNDIYKHDVHSTEFLKALKINFRVSDLKWKSLFPAESEILEYGGQFGSRLWSN